MFLELKVPSTSLHWHYTHDSVCWSVTHFLRIPKVSIEWLVEPHSYSNLHSPKPVPLCEGQRRILLLSYAIMTPQTLLCKDHASFLNVVPRNRIWWFWIKIAIFRSYNGSETWSREAEREYEILSYYLVLQKYNYLAVSTALWHNLDNTQCYVEYLCTKFLQKIITNYMWWKNIWDALQ